MVKQRRLLPLLMTALFALTLFGTSARAAGLPDYYPTTYQWLGTINEVRLGERVIIIRDAFFKLAKKVKVYTPRSQYATLQKLRPGMRVGCRFTTNEQGTRVISAIWLFPASQRGMLPPPTSHR